MKEKTRQKRYVWQKNYRYCPWWKIKLRVFEPRCNTPNCLESFQKIVNFWNLLYHYYACTIILSIVILLRLLISVQKYHYFALIYYMKFYKNSKCIIVCINSLITERQSNSNLKPLRFFEGYWWECASTRRHVPGLT